MHTTRCCCTSNENIRSATRSRDISSAILNDVIWFNKAALRHRKPVHLTWLNKPTMHLSHIPHCTNQNIYGYVSFLTGAALLSFVRGIHRSPVNSPHKGQWRRDLIFSSINAWMNYLVNNRKAGDLGRHRAHYDVTVMPRYCIRSRANLSWFRYLQR